MVIKTLILENFQGHKHSVIDFHPNFNVIRGTGNSGKSSIVRALSCILYGVWEGRWVRDNEKTCKLSLVMDNGVEVIREKGEKVNKYTLRVPGFSEQVYENFGLQVPEPVEKALQIFKAQIDAKETLLLNISQQLDSLFLLSKPGSYKAKVIGKLSGAHYLDYALRELNKDKKTLSTEKTVFEQELLTRQKEIIDYEGLDSEKRFLEQLEQKLSDLSGVESKLVKLKELSKKSQTWKENYLREKDKAARLSNIQVDNLSSVEGASQRLLTLQKMLVKLTEISNTTKMLTSKNQQLESDQEKHTTTYTELLKEAGVCPTCFNEIGEAACNHIKRALHV